MKYTKQQFSIIIFLGLVIILLFGGILYNQFAISSITATTQTENTPSLLPSISEERRWGSENEDLLVDCFIVDDKTFIFYNSDNKGKMLIVDKNETSMDIEGKIKFVCIAFDGFAVALEKENGFVLQLLDQNGAPTTSTPITYPSAQIQYFTYQDGNLTVGVRSKGSYDYLFSYLQYDKSLNLVLERIIYSVYNLSLVKCYPLSNSTILFFNAEYGSVKKGCYSILTAQSKGVETTYFPLSEGYCLLDAIPTQTGFFVACKDKSNALFSITLSYSYSTTTHSFETGTIDGAKLYGDGNNYYCYKYGKTYALYTYDTICKKAVEFARDAKVLDCIFIDGSAVFALSKNGKTYLYHAQSGISCVILNYEASTIKLVAGKKLTFFTTTSLPSYAQSYGKNDIYMGVLQ